MSDTVYKRPKVEKYDCPICGKNMKVSLGTPSESICSECKKMFLEWHESDNLENCPFCNADRSQVCHSLSVPFLYGPEGVRVRCKCCGAMSGVGGIYHYVDNTCSKPPLFNRETIEDGFKKANEKWNRRKS